MTYTTESTVDFADYIANERAKLVELKQAMLETQHKIARDLAALEAEFEAIEAYEQVKLGKAKANGGTRVTRGKGTRIRTTGKRSEVLELISINSGLGRAQIIDALGARGDKSAEMSISNALTALVKADQLTRENGKYFAQAA